MKLPPRCNIPRWIARGESGRFVLKRLRNADAVLTPAALAELHSTASQFLGRPYDLTFEWSDDLIYCSELVWKFYQRALGIRLGELEKMRRFNLDDPAVRAELRERFGAHPPLDEPVISPAAIFRSPALVTIMKK